MIKDGHDFQKKIDQSQFLHTETYERVNVKQGERHCTADLHAVSGATLTITAPTWDQVYGALPAWAKAKGE